MSTAMRTARWIACGGTIVLGVALIVVVVGMYLRPLLREDDARLYPWSQRRSNIQRPALSDYKRQARQQCAVPDEVGHAPKVPGAKWVQMYLPVSHTELPDLSTPLVLQIPNLTISRFEFVWLPLEFVDVSESLYQIALFGVHPNPRQLPDRLQIRLGADRTLLAELPPAEKNASHGRLHFYSGCWQKGRFVPPLGWQGFVPEVAWSSFDWVLVYPTESVKKPVRWVFPKSLDRVVYWSVHWDQAGGIKEVIIAFAPDAQQPMEIGLVGEEGVQVVSITGRDASRPSTLADGYRFCYLYGEDLSARFSARP